MDKLVAQIYVAKTDYRIITSVYHKKKATRTIAGSSWFLSVVFLLMQQDGINIRFLVSCYIDIGDSGILVSINTVYEKTVSTFF